MLDKWFPLTLGGGAARTSPAPKSRGGAEPCEALASLAPRRSQTGSQCIHVRLRERSPHGPGLIKACAALLDERATSRAKENSELSMATKMYDACPRALLAEWRRLLFCLRQGTSNIHICNVNINTKGAALK